MVNERTMNTPSSYLDGHIEKEPKLQQTTLIFVFNPEWQLLMAVKKKTQSGFDVAVEKINAAWGKVEEGESIEQGALRELYDELGIVATEDKLEKAGVIRFIFETKPQRSNECHVYMIKNFTGSYKESDNEGDEMEWLRYFDVDDLPYENMRECDRIWLPKMLRGEELDEEFLHDDQWNVIK